MPVYEVKPGRHFGPMREYGPGDEVILSPQEAKGFEDKLTLKGEESPQQAQAAKSAKPQKKPAQKKGKSLKDVGVDPAILDKLQAGEVTHALDVYHMGDGQLSQMGLTEGEIVALREVTHAHIA